MERQSYPLPLCQSNHISNFICLNKDCTYSSFICPLQGCQTCILHKNCTRKPLKQLIDNFMNKGLVNDQIQRIINTLILFYQSMSKKFDLYAQNLISIRNTVGFSQQQIEFAKKINENSLVNVSKDVIVKNLENNQRNKVYNIPLDISDVIENQLMANSQKFLKLKMFNYKQITPKTILETFQIAVKNEEISKQVKELKNVLINQGKIMTFWTFQLDNLKNITDVTDIEQIQYLKMLSLKDWSFRKLQLIGKYLPNLKQFRAIDCNLDDSDAVIITSSANFQNLQTLNLHNNKITGYGGIIIASAFESAATNLFLGQNPISQDAKQRIMQLKPKTQWVLPWTFNLSY